MCKDVIAEMRAKRFIPTGTTEVEIVPLRNIHAVVYVAEQNGSFTATAYVRRGKKPAFSYRFRTKERREEYVRKWVDGEVKHEARKQAERKARSAGHSLKVGDVLNTSWGYDQTNVDYYQVVGLKGKATVKLREIAARQHDESHVLPAVDSFIGETFEKRVNQHNAVRISSCQRATPTSKDEAGNYLPSHKTPWGMGH